MDNEQIQSLIKQLKAAGLDDDQIMDVFYETFQKGEMDRNDLETLAEAMGYELTDDFKNDAQPDPIQGGGDVGDMSKEQLEDAKEIDQNESAEEFKDKLGIDGEENSTAEEGEEDSEPEDQDDDEDEEGWKKAQEMFRV